MAGRIVTSNRGFTYIAALMIIIIMGIMLGAAGQSWRTIMQREREEELIFRGQQFKAALERWHKQLPGKPPPRPLNELKDLLKDPNSLEKVRYLRRLYLDPITGKEWNVVKDPVKGVVAVFSSSEEEPLKKANFPKGLETFEGKTKYSDWQFGLPGSPVKPGTLGTPSTSGVPGTTVMPGTQAIPGMKAGGF